MLCDRDGSQNRADRIPVMMMITKVLTITVGEDNKKTEMYDI